jgi:hypothetical protein
MILAAAGIDEPPGYDDTVQLIERNRGSTAKSVSVLHTVNARNRNGSRRRRANTRSGTDR